MSEGFRIATLCALWFFIGLLVAWAFRQDDTIAGLAFLCALVLIAVTYVAAKERWG